jgi:hypothetical protein
MSQQADQFRSDYVELVVARREPVTEEVINRS